MELDFQIFLQINLYLVLFYLIYAIFLKKETHFKLNRLYLIGSVFLSVLIPTVELPELATQTISNSQIAETVQNFTLSNPTQNAQESDGLFWVQTAIVLYVIGVLVMLIRFAFGLGQIGKLISSSNRKKEKGFWRVELEEPAIAFSFFNFLFWHESEQVEESEKRKIITHELAHIRQFHSFDIVFLEVISAIFWLNPVCYFYQKAIRNVHEFLADEATVPEKSERTAYSELLLDQFLESDNSYLTSQFFNQSILKKRIMMLHKIKSSKTAMFKVLWAIPVLAICLFVNACAEKSLEPISAGKSTLVKVKTYDLPTDKNEIAYTVLFSQGTDYKVDFPEEMPDGTYFAILDSNGVEIINNRNEKPYTKIIYTETATAVRKIVVKSDKKLSGKLELLFNQSTIPKPKLTKDGFAEGYTTIQKTKFTVENEIVLDVEEGTNIAFIIDEKNNNVEGIVLNVFDSEGKKVGANLYNEKYYAEMTQKCRETGKMTIKVSYAGEPRPFTLKIAERKK
ncbi:MAG: hypothetical protein ACJAWV_000121 [Flammeovirgaceae bacterium]|jgi:hypothetical protein